MTRYRRKPLHVFHVAILSSWLTISACSGSDGAGNTTSPEAGGATTLPGVGGQVTTTVGGSVRGGATASSGTSASGNGGTAIGNGGATNVAGTTNGGTTNQQDLAEKGLCQITMTCSQNIPDSPAIDCGFELKDSIGQSVYADRAAVQVRGRTSSRFPKKNYGIELRTANNQDNPTNLLGMGQEADWVLDGAWADRSFMRNRLTFGLFRDMSPERWAPQARYCELTINGKYAGIYVLLEKIKRDDDRVVLPDDDGTGSTFIVKQDEDGTLRLSLGVSSTWEVIYPNSNVITTTQTRAVQTWLDQLGAALRSSNPADILGLLDSAAVIDWILVEEFAKNIDAYNLSLHFARASGGLARVIPWDTDLAYGQPTLSNAPNDRPEGWVHNRTSLITKLSQNASIRQGLGPRWRELRQGIFSTQAIMARLDGYAAILNSEAIARNFALWPIQNVDFSQFYAPYTFYDVTSYAEEVTHFRDWITQRLTWLDANIDAYPAK